MAHIRDLIALDHPRVALLNDGTLAATDAECGCVLLWVQRAQRATWNHAANTAVEIVNALRVPVVAGFCLAPGYPRATLRAYRFMAEGLDALPAAFAERGIGWELRVGEPAEVIPAFARNLGAVAVVTDLDPLRTGREWRATVAARLSVPLLTVDTDTVVPSALFEKEEWAARTIRPKILRVLDSFVETVPDPVPVCRSAHRAGPTALDAINDLELDRTVPPSPIFTGGTAQARSRLASFVAGPLDRYDTLRNRADLDATSHLSPYLHFGQISPMEVVVAVRAGAPPPQAEAAFINEVVVQRELAINFALRNPDYDRYEGIPSWGAKTLADHANDVRPITYSRDELDASQTHDRLWNAAQRQMVAEGYLPNRLRMYWAKQVLRWTDTPREAFDILVALNDRSFVDGRDAAGYASIAWAVGGRHDRPFPPQKPITGLIRPMGMAAMRRYFDPEAYIAKIEASYGLPDAVTADFPFDLL